MNPILLFNRQSLRRSQVIANRTNSVKTGIVKAMMIAELKNKLANGIAHFVFIKKNGEVREAWGTTCPSFVDKYVNGKGMSREVYNSTAYFDIDKCSWRSLRWESIIKVF